MEKILSHFVRSGELQGAGLVVAAETEKTHVLVKVLVGDAAFHSERVEQDFPFSAAVDSSVWWEKVNRVCCTSMTRCLAASGETIMLLILNPQYPKCSAYGISHFDLGCSHLTKYLERFRKIGTMRSMSNKSKLDLVWAAVA